MKEMEKIDFSFTRPKIIRRASNNKRGETILFSRDNYLMFTD